MLPASPTMVCTARSSSPRAVPADLAITRRRACCPERAHDAATCPDVGGGARHCAVVFRLPNTVGIMRPVVDRRFFWIRLSSAHVLQGMPRRQGRDGLDSRPFALESPLLAATK